MSSSKLIRNVASAGEAVAWQAPDVAAFAGKGSEIDAEQLRREAFEQGFEKGQSKGFATGSARVNAHIESLRRVLDLFTQPMANLDHRVEEEIVSLVKAIAQHLLRREMKTDSSHLVGVIREGLSALPIADEKVVLRLHADDATVIEEYLGTNKSEHRWKIEVDPLVEKGGCLIFTANSQIDGRLETRLSRLIGAMFENERRAIDGEDTGNELADD